ncbi:MAG: hypothetical protein Fur002_08880 [Anaerolineales bacterium]
MEQTQTTPTLDLTQKRFKGSLAGTLVRTLLIFTFIPFAIMAGAAYVRARTLLREQAVVQYQSLLTAQVGVIEQETLNKETQLKGMAENADFRRLVELGLHANALRPLEFDQIRSGLLLKFEDLNNQPEAPSFNNLLILDSKGNVKISNTSRWQGKAIDIDLFSGALDAGYSSSILYGLPPLYENSLTLITVIPYRTERGSLLGYIAATTEGTNLQRLTQPLNGLKPLADVYFILPSHRLIYQDKVTNDFLITSQLSPSQRQADDALTQKIQMQDTTPAALDVKASDKSAALAEVQWVPAIQMGVALEVKESYIYRQVTSLAPFTIALTLITLALMAVVLYFGTARIIKPLRALSDITQKFAEGEWRLRAQVDSQDEVGFLAKSFNRMADELQEMYFSLEKKVDERTRQFETSAEIANSFASLSNLDDLLDRAVKVLASKFGYYQVSVFLLDVGGTYLEFKSGYGAATEKMRENDYRLKVGSNSLMGWVSANNQPRIASNVLGDEIHLKNELLPETRSEATLPISIGGLALGVLDVQSVEENAFSPESVTMLQALASQLAAAIQKASLAEMSELDFEELARLYRSSRALAQSNTEEQALNITNQILKEAPYVVALLQIEKNGLRVFSTSDETKQGAPLRGVPENIPAATEEIEKYLSRGAIIDTPKIGRAPEALKTLAEKMNLESAAYLPIRKNDSLSVVIVMGLREGSLSSAALQPYTSFADLVTVSLDKAESVLQTERRLREVEALASINESTSRSSNLEDFFDALRQKIQQVIGNYSLIVAFYDEKADAISVPYSYEDGKTQTIESFPLGEGLTSILIHTRKPLMLVEDTERKAAELGAKIVGKPARSWMGAPMLVQNTPIGAIIIQDAENENAFDEQDLMFFTTITNQVAGVVHNVQLLTESQHKAVQLETAAEIAKDISGSLNIDELLTKAVNLIRQRFNFYHASIFLHDLQNEFAVIREATGEAGAQLKRAGYKIGIGSKSIVGFVSSRGEPLIINDTSKDATYYANQLLPNTRAEAAIPMKIGDRTLGVLDVQSEKAYAFSEENLRSLQILADQIAVAVINSELFAETQEHLSQHRLLHHITTQVASGTTLDEALESAVEGLQVTLGGDRVIILLADQEKKHLEVKASVGYSEEAASLRIPMGSGIIGWVAAYRRTLRVKDVLSDARYMQISENTRSELAVPLVYRNELLGVLNVESEQVDAYAESDEEMMGTLGGSLAAIIANARLLEQIRQQAERERMVNEISNKIRRSTDIQSIMVTTASEITRITGARHAKLNITAKKEQG